MRIIFHFCFNVACPFHRCNLVSNWNSKLALWWPHSSFHVWKPKQQIKWFFFDLTVSSMKYLLHSVVTTTATEKMVFIYSNKSCWHYESNIKLKIIALLFGDVAVAINGTRMNLFVPNWIHVVSTWPVWWQSLSKGKWQYWHQRSYCLTKKQFKQERKL